jgi:hypothetical protein
MPQSRLFQLLAAVLLTLLSVSAAQAGKAIALVYDDSGSMASRSNPRWVPANYAVQVLAAMGGEGDSLFLVRMSAPTVARPFPGVQGINALLSEFSHQDPPQKNTATPYQSVRTAIDALVGSGMDEKWLLVLTDGVFSEEENNGAAIEPRVREDIELAVRRQHIHAAFLIIQQPEHRVDALWQNEGGAERFNAVSAAEIPAKMEAAADLLNARSSLKKGGISIAAQGGELRLSSRFPLRQLIVLRQDGVAGNLLEAQDAGGHALTLRKHEVQAIRPTRGLPIAHIAHIKPGRVIEAGAEVVRLRFDGPVEKMHIKLLPEVAVRFETALKDAKGQILKPNDSGAYTLCKGDAVKFSSRLTDDSGQPIKLEHEDMAALRIGVEIGGGFQPQNADSQGLADFSLNLSPEHEVVLRGIAEYPGYFHFRAEPIRLRPGNCTREVRLSVAGVDGDGYWRAEVDRVEAAPYVEVAATVDGQPVSADEAKHWQLTGDGGEAANFDWLRTGPTWRIRPKTACCAWWLGRAQVGETRVGLKLATANPRDQIQSPPPLHFAITAPSSPWRARWWQACPFAVPALVLALLFYLWRLMVKQRFAKKACLWVQNCSDRKVRRKLFRREANWLLRWFWPSARERVRIGGLGFIATGTGQMVSVSGKSLGQYHEIDNWRFDDRAKAQGRPQMDARLNDKADLVLRSPGNNRRGVFVYRYQYSRDGAGPFDWD